MARMSSGAVVVDSKLNEPKVYLETTIPSTWLGGRAPTCSSLLTKKPHTIGGNCAAGVRPVHFAVCAEGSPCGRRLLRQPAGGTPARYSDIGSEPGDIGIGGGFGH